MDIACTAKFVAAARQHSAILGGLCISAGSSTTMASPVDRPGHASVPRRSGPADRPPAPGPKPQATGPKMLLRVRTDPDPDDGGQIRTRRLLDC